MIQPALATHAATPGAKGEKVNTWYVWMIAFVAALGGLLFGYDWVVIGGAKPFYEVYFGLHSASAVGWANSCALLGCFAGSLLASSLSEALGRRKALVLSALLFTVSSVLTGWSFTFVAFVLWRIVGGLAIGLASNVSPTYIAEVSPAQLRGRLVSLNQLALVIGILIAQIANWRIAQRVYEGLSPTALLASWNVQFGWRWMFTAVAIPSLLLLTTAPFIPESPRWLARKGRTGEAEEVLRRIGGLRHSKTEMQAICETITETASTSPLRDLLTGYRRLLLIGIGLTVLQQGCGINVLFNYAEEVYRSAGYGVNDLLFNIVITGAINLVFTLAAMAFVDRLGRRSLMLLGCSSIGVLHLAASFAYAHKLKGTWILVLTLSAIACYAMTLAPITWVLITEIFPNRVRATAVSLSVAMLWVACFVLTYTFPLLNAAIGTSGSFLTYGGICLLGSVFIFLAVPETKGKSLEAIEEVGTDLSI